MSIEVGSSIKKISSGCSWLLHSQHEPCAVNLGLALDFFCCPLCSPLPLVSPVSLNLQVVLPEGAYRITPSFPVPLEASHEVSSALSATQAMHGSGFVCLGL